MYKYAPAGCFTSKPHCAGFMPVVLLPFVYSNPRLGVFVICDLEYSMPACAALTAAKEIADKAAEIFIEVKV